MEQDTLYRTLKEIANGHVYVAICNMRDYASNHSIGMWRDELESLISDYELMMDYLGRGIIDPDREKIHMRISTRLERCVRNIMLYNKTLASPFYQEAKRKGGDIPLDAQALFLLVEAVDPLMISCTDGEAAEALGAAYRADLQADSATRVFGRPAVLFSKLDSLMDSDAGKQRAWKLLKSLPRR